MKKEINITVSLLLAFCTVIGALFVFSQTQKVKHERALYERAYVGAGEACERLTLSLFAASKSFSASDVSSVGEEASLFMSKLGDLSLDELSSAPLYRFLSLVDEISKGSLQLIDSGEKSEYYMNLFGKFAPLSKRLEDEFLPTLSRGPDYELLSDIFSELGGIYYDGVYSDEEREGLFPLLRSATLLKRDEVMGSVEKLLGKNAKLKSSLVQAFPPFYSFYCENASLDVSQMGGYVLRFLYDRRPSGRECTSEEARAEMESFLELLGFGGLELIEYSDEGDYIGVFAPRVGSDAGDILCLSERIKICVGAASGKVTAFDATDYYKYHRIEREVKESDVPVGAELVYIIASDGREILCYVSDGEYYGVSDGKRRIKIY